MITDYCTVVDDNSTTEENIIVNAWLGPSNTVSCLHHDPYHNMFAQVVGTKRVYLIDPKHSKMLYPNHDDKGRQKNTSRVVDVDKYFEDPALQNLYPNFAQLPELYSITLNAGDMLYIPPTWWHFVRSCSFSFSVSFWWQ